MNKEKANYLANEKLLNSGLTAEDANILGIETLSSEEASGLGAWSKKISSLKINYFCPRSGAPMADWGGTPPFYRLRYLETIDGLTKQMRYTQPPNTLPCAYFPRNVKNWKELISDAREPLIITEGEFKAAKACKEEFATIGLGGVYNFRARKAGIEFLDSLQIVDWSRRHVYICFDSDYKTNENVCSALIALSEELQRRGAFCYVVTLPQLPNLEKVGLDDFLTFADDSRNQFKHLLRVAEPLGAVGALFDFNKKYVYVQSGGLIVDQKTKAKVSPAAFKDHLQSTTLYTSRALQKNGEFTYKTVSAAAEWLKWSLRNEVHKLTYKPSCDAFFIEDSLPNFNLWTGWGCAPESGDVHLFLELLNHLFHGAEAEAKKWFLQWCAYPIQNAGTKLFSSVVFHGVKHGTGKSLVGYTLGRIYGKNFTEISQNDLHGAFNEWAECKQFVLGDDVTGSNKRADADFLKKLITQKELRVNAKYISSYTVPDCINYFFTANHPDSFFLEDDDRRFFIHEILVSPLPEEFYKKYNAWLCNGGDSIIFDYLLNLDLSDFNPAAPAFKTDAKRRMIATVRSELAAWVRSLLDSADAILVTNSSAINKDLFSSKELLALYDPMGRTGTTAQGLGRELGNAGVRQVLNGQPLKLRNGVNTRFYAVRNTEKWLNASAKEILAHLSGFGGEKTEKY